MADKDKNSKAQVKFRKITEKLYECLCADNSCRNRFTFASRSFCSWLMKNEAGRSENNFPCCDEGKSEEIDS